MSQGALQGRVGDDGATYEAPQEGADYGTLQDVRATLFIHPCDGACGTLPATRVAALPTARAAACMPPL